MNANPDLVWAEFFNMELVKSLKADEQQLQLPGKSKPTRIPMVFNYSIQTDGVSVSLLFRSVNPIPPRRKGGSTPQSSVGGAGGAQHEKLANLQLLPNGTYEDTEIIERFKLASAASSASSSAATTTPSAPFQAPPGVIFISVDPGLKDLIHAYCVNDRISCFKLSKKQYHHVTRIQRHTRERTNAFPQDIHAKLSTVSAHTVDLVKIKKYLIVLGQVWDQLWKVVGYKSHRRKKFKQHQRMQVFWGKFNKDIHQKFQQLPSVKAANAHRLPTTSAAISTPSNSTLQSTSPPTAVTAASASASTSESAPEHKIIFLFGAGGRHGEWGKIRGVGLHGPTKKFANMLAAHYPVVMCNEYRTSKCCFRCGQALLHPRRRKPNSSAKHPTARIGRVSYCDADDHNYCLHRDKDACCKIAFRFLAQLYSQPLGPWRYIPRKRGEKRTNVKRDLTRPVADGDALLRFSQQLIF